MIKVYEAIDSMSGSISNESEGGEVREVKRRYVIGQCYGGFNEVIAEITPYCPTYVQADPAGIFWKRNRLEVAGIGNGYFDCTATYQTLQPKQPPDPANPSDFTPGSLSWDTTGHQEHITQGLDTETSYPAGAADFESAINVSGDSVQGVDVVRPLLRYSETWILPVQLAVNCTFVGTIYKLTGTVNSQAFRCFDAGEALFMGGRAQWKGDEPFVSVTFDWECRPNQTIANGLALYVKAVGAIEKQGWEHIWIQYAPETSMGSLIRKPVAAYVNRVYPKKSWAALGLIGGQIAAPRAGQAGRQAQQGGNNP